VGAGPAAPTAWAPAAAGTASTPHNKHALKREVLSSRGVAIVAARPHTGSTPGTLFTSEAVTSRGSSAAGTALASGLRLSSSSSSGRSMVMAAEGYPAVASCLAVLCCQRRNGGAGRPVTSTD